MKILFLTDEFYPRFGANSLLVQTLAREFIKDGNQVLVMPFSYERNLPTSEYWQGIEVIRTIPYDDKRALIANLKRGRFLSAVKIGWKCCKERCFKKERVLQKDRIAARKVLENFIKENKIDTVISICCSIELSFPLLYLRKKNKLPCKWIFYMMDPFESHSYYRGIEKIATLRKIQHEIMQRCDHVVMTGLIYKDTKDWETDEILKKISVVEFPKIERPILQPCEEDVLLDSTTINIVCTGSKNEEVRSSTYTLQLCEQLQKENVTFHFIGQGWSDNEKDVKGNCVFYKARSHQAIRNLQMKTDFLLNIGNAVFNQLPSKVLEYISTGKPIINVAKRKDCPTIALLEKADSVTVFENEDLDATILKIKDFITKEHKVKTFDEIEKQYEEYTPKCVAKQFLTEEVG